MMTAIEKEKTHGKPRSPQWPAVRRAYLKDHALCALCGGKKKLEVHHVLPFNLRPELELEPSNFVTLCENKSDGVNCHLLGGHLGSFRSYNPAVRKDVETWAKKIENRPAPGIEEKD